MGFKTVFDEVWKCPLDSLSDFRHLRKLSEDPSEFDFSRSNRKAFLFLGKGNAAGDKALEAGTECELFGNLSFNTLFCVRRAFAASSGSDL